MSDAPETTADEKRDRRRVSTYIVVSDAGVKFVDSVTDHEPPVAPVLMVVTPDRLDFYLVPIRENGSAQHALSFSIEGSGVLQVKRSTGEVLAAYSPAGWWDMTTVFDGVTARAD